MIIHLHKSFERSFSRLPQKLRAQFKKRRDIFLEDPRDPILKNHPLHAEFAGYRSINITGDLRVIYKEIGPNVVEFAKIGTHHELFGS